MHRPHVLESRDPQPSPVAPQVDTRLQKPSQWCPPADNLGGRANTWVCGRMTSLTQPGLVCRFRQLNPHLCPSSGPNSVSPAAPGCESPREQGERDRSQEVVMRLGRESGCEDREDGDNCHTKVGWSGEEAGGPDICGTREGRGCPLSQRPGSASWCLVFL